MHISEIFTNYLLLRYVRFALIIHTIFKNNSNLLKHDHAMIAMSICYVAAQ